MAAPPSKSYRAVIGALLLVLTGCASHRAPTPETSRRMAPDLTGRVVMVLPAQGGAGARPPIGLDDEIRYWLGDRAPDVQWVFPLQLRSVLERTPALSDIHINALSVSHFRGAEVRRIGDPLFGDLRRLGAVVDARYALVPVTAAYVPGDTVPGRVEVAAALIDTLGGDVLWYGVAGGDRGDERDPRVIASAARALAGKVAR